MDLANYLRLQMVQLGLSNTEVAIRANISRLTWYRLLRGDIMEVKISTLVAIAYALDLHFYQLLAVRFNKKRLPYSETTPPYASHFINDSSYPQNSVVTQNETFTKKWTVVNFGSYDWEEMQLQCAKPLNINSDNFCQQPLYDKTCIPDAKVGESIEISVKITAPSRPCTIVSEWEIVDKYNQPLPQAQFAALNCMVRVI
jgi:transcriptional regulator with XRE-family HTH domain